MLMLSMHPCPSRNLLTECLTHDMGERFAGDIPRPVKTQNPTLAQDHEILERQMRDANFRIERPYLTTDEHRWLKLIDALECIMWAGFTVPDVLTTDPWEELIRHVIAEGREVFPAPTVSVYGLIDGVIVTRGCEEQSSVAKE